MYIFNMRDIFDCFFFSAGFFVSIDDVRCGMFYINCKEIFIFLYKKEGINEEQSEEKGKKCLI